MSYDWPGNVRELENVIERGLILSTSNVLELGDWLPVAKNQSRLERTMSTKNFPPLTLEEMERVHILEVLKEKNWKIRGDDGAAIALGLNPTTLEARIKKLGLKHEA